mmetsp:Transcript_55400/g.154340  ORF Transcript_55400/g.154340 Transcript_55400/m.154340 type:complete len:206 (-) Transcript_55400:1946-2563(-)
MSATTACRDAAPLPPSGGAPGRCLCCSRLEVSTARVVTAFDSSRRAERRSSACKRFSTSFWLQCDCMTSASKSLLRLRSWIRNSRTRANSCFFLLIMSICSAMRRSSCNFSSSIRLERSLLWTESSSWACMARSSCCFASSSFWSWSIRLWNCTFTAPHSCSFFSSSAICPSFKATFCFIVWSSCSSRCWMPLHSSSSACTSRLL